MCRGKIIFSRINTTPFIMSSSVLIIVVVILLIPWRVAMFGVALIHNMVHLVKIGALLSMIEISSSSYSLFTWANITPLRFPALFLFQMIFVLSMVLAKIFVFSFLLVMPVICLSYLSCCIMREKTRLILERCSIKRICVLTVL